jgi:hypothetical protein
MPGTLDAGLKTIRFSGKARGFKAVFLLFFDFGLAISPGKKDNVHVECVCTKDNGMVPGLLTHRFGHRGY